MDKKKRCPNGSRKNKHGDCVKNKTMADVLHKTPTPSPPSPPPPPPPPKTPTPSPPSSVKQSITKKKERCPKGSRKNKHGVCVKNKTMADVLHKTPTQTPPSLIKPLADATPTTTTTTTPKTPRGIYAKTYHTTEIMLSDRDLTGSNQNALLQFTFSDVKQFEDYVPLTLNPRIECFYQTLFTLGLRKTKLLKKEVEEINIKGKIGVVFTDAAELFAESFGIPKRDVVFRTSNDIKEPDINNEMNTFFDGKLKENHATIIGIFFTKKNSKIVKSEFAHFIVVYKNNNTIYYFDPQNKQKYNQREIINTNILRITQKYKAKGYKIFAYGYYKVSDLTHPMPLLINECPLIYV